MIEFSVKKHCVLFTAKVLIHALPFVKRGKGNNSLLMGSEKWNQNSWPENPETYEVWEILKKQRDPSNEVIEPLMTTYARLKTTEVLDMDEITIL